MAPAFSSRSWLLALLLFVAGTSAASAQAVKRVEFPAGGTGVTLKGTVAKDSIDYIVRARAGHP